ncbi:methyltransferase family protein [Nocardioides albertanoniae]|uniref:Methyltransferase family protein n=1 Tax=Nocardioides albertanoniae TaxID=1175486 RepID=A0A543A9W4_9ACTN|nr:class I SAM-dependent methyltransferase [Nocardioides albertanoniae]TQL69397.1 methyltransferase family protein [Nocardioides albertanoniae]
MSHYAVEIDLEQPNTSHVQVIDLASAASGPETGATRVLDVGCWTGEVGRILTERGCSVTGIEIDTEAARLAEKVLDRVVVADLDEKPLTELVEPGSFDVVIFADVLEHLVDPRAALEQARELLAPGGRVVISIPNVTHGSVRLALLQGRWQTTETGLLDRTHIKFYSREGLATLFTEAGYAIEDLRGTTADPLNVEVAIDPADLPEASVEWVRRQPDALVYQFQLSARPLADGESSAAVPDLVEAAPAEDVRLRDAHTKRFEEVHRSRLATRDHILGVQASANSAQARVGVLSKQLRESRAINKRRRERIERLRGKVAGLEADLTYATRHPVRNFGRRVVRRLRRVGAS